MGHDGPAHLAISARDPLLRGLGVYHGKRGWGVSVEFDVRHGPVTTFGVGQERDGSFVFVASEGEVVHGPLLAIGNTTSRVDFGLRPRRVGRRLERHRHRAPLGPVARAPRRRLRRRGQPDGA